MLNKTGIPSRELVESGFPQLTSSFKALIECYQEIPCNPCEAYCPFKAIQIGDNINALPKLIYENCVGCGICVEVCPGLAIMLVKENKENVSFIVPYELGPKPKVNSDVNIINRSSEVIGQGKVIGSRTRDKRNLITLECPKEFVMEFGGIVVE